MLSLRKALLFEGYLVQDRTQLLVVFLLLTSVSAWMKYAHDPFHPNHYYALYSYALLRFGSPYSDRPRSG
jgi:hypothetical protein